MLRKVFKQLLIIAVVLLIAGCSKIMTSNDDMIDNYHIITNLAHRDNRVYIEGTITNKTVVTQEDIEILYYVAFKEEPEKYYLVETIDFDVLEVDKQVSFIEDITDDLKELGKGLSDIVTTKVSVQYD